MTRLAISFNEAQSKGEAAERSHSGFLNWKTVKRHLSGTTAKTWRNVELPAQRRLLHGGGRAYGGCYEDRFRACVCVSVHFITEQEISFFESLLLMKEDNLSLSS